jgi:hypothetical protein
MAFGLGWDCGPLIHLINTKLELGFDFQNQFGTGTFQDLF